MFLAALCVLVCGGSWSLVGLGWCCLGLCGWCLAGAGGNCHVGGVVQSHSTMLHTLQITAAVQLHDILQISTIVQSRSDTTKLASPN